MTSWWAKAALAMLAVGLASASGINAAANHWRMSRPDVALAWRPGDAVALTVREDRRLMDADTDITPAGAAITAAIARRALQSDPLTAPALRQIAMVQQRPDRARALVLLAHHVSRRELGSLIWLIQDSFDGGTAQSVLRYFDEALLTNPIAPEMLYPALSAGLVDPSLRAGLVPLLRDQRFWMAGFLHHAATTGDSAQYVAALVIAAGGLPASDGYTGLNSQVLSSLAGRHDFALARAYLRRINGTGRDIAVDPRFTVATVNNDLGLFAWELTDQEALAGRLGENGDLEVRVGAGQRGTVAQRIMMLPPGRYQFVESVAVPVNGAPADVRWEWRCFPARPGDPLWVQDVPGRSGVIASPIDVPPNCIAQQLVLIAGDDGEQDEARMTLGKLMLRRL